MGEISKINMGGVDYNIRDKVLEEQLGNINAKPMVSVTYAELVTLRDNGGLIAGMQYRITDYVTTTAQENTRSAGHQFDVIVTADNKNTLNEVARACKSDFDIEKYKDAYSGTWGEKMLYLGTQEYEGKEYHLYESESHNFQVLVDFNNILERFPSTSDVYTFIYYPNYARDFDDSSGWGVWECGKDCNESIDFKYSEPNYFATSKLETWQIWYSLDNDAERFAWADAENGKGVIYRMIDEWNNDCPYDFKNIQYKRNLNFDEGFAQFSEDGEETWVYTFAGQSYHINNDEWSDMLDGSLESPFGHMSDEKTSTFHDNTIKPYIMVYNGNDIYAECGIRYLNDIVFLGYWEKIGSSNDEDMPYYYAYCCFSNSFGDDCGNNSFGNNCNSNSFGDNCNYNSFGNNCNSNSFGDGCNSNSFGDGCSSNSFGDDCGNNSFGISCNYNSFGNNCFSNSFGDNCSSNSFGNNCNPNSFGDGCSNNIFGNGCGNNSFGNNCNYNSFGNSCNSVKLSENTIRQTASINSNKVAKVFNLADLADLINK